MTKATRAVQTPGDSPQPTTATETAAAPAADAFQANAIQTGGDPSGDPADENALLRQQLAAQAEQIAALTQAVQNLATQSPAAKVSPEALLPDYPDAAALKAWYEQYDDMAPRLTKQGWLVHPMQGASQEALENARERKERREERAAKKG